MHTAICKLGKRDLKGIYAYMLEDFPDNERKPLDMIERSFDTGFMEGYGYVSSEGELLAYALFVKLEQVLLLDYFAVLQEKRAQGVGSKFLQGLQEQLKNFECVILEVENPDYAADPAEKKLMEQRIGFYIRNGVRDTGGSGRVYGVEYRFLEMKSMREHSAEEAKERIGRFYHTYWPDEKAFNRFVQMHG